MVKIFCGPQKSQGSAFVYSAPAESDLRSLVTTQHVACSLLGYTAIPCLLDQDIDECKEPPHAFWYFHESSLKDDDCGEIRCRSFEEFIGRGASEVPASKYLILAERCEMIASPSTLLVEDNKYIGKVLEISDRKPRNGECVWLVGYPDGCLRQKRVAGTVQNQSGNRYIIHTTNGCSEKGMSGGPWFHLVDGRLKVLGVNIGVSDSDRSQALAGDIQSGQVRLAKNASSLSELRDECEEVWREIKMRHACGHAWNNCKHPSMLSPYP